ncbi:MAG TPA: hypothetical protein VMC08_09370 [Bacteroidales bacterium]|nr:hypothetical protein [Bacteroidales bacterium]
MNSKDLEKYSSAFTLSDMEIFIFPDLMYAMVLANILSPEIWKWRHDPWFSGIEKMAPLKRIHRVKQFIMDRYDFNLDLETWGLTDKQTEINRFGEFIDPDVLSRSNALFGYEGDKYYFSMDIRRHFGLDKYDSDVIPYWKTETVEAMNAFRFKPGRERGAGECVSLACLYAAALFIAGRIPLEKIFLMGTPLHSQNFILTDEGVLTNNRRIITKPMWFNGTELTTLARRALENEQVTIVAHGSGYIHSLYPEATIDKEAYLKFRDRLNRYLESPLSFETFVNFLRSHNRYQKFFQLTWVQSGIQKYIPLEKAFSYEHGSKNRLGDRTARNLLAEIDEEDLIPQPVDFRAILDAGDPLYTLTDLTEFRNRFLEQYPRFANHTAFFQDLKKFHHTNPKLPSVNKTYLEPAGHRDTGSPENLFALSPDLSQEEISSQLSAWRQLSPVADLAFYAGRYMDACDWKPFLKAAFERNPVSLEFFHEMDLDQVYRDLQSWPDKSIYDGNRMAMPDEVVNFKRGDGLEKALTLVNCIKSRKEDDHLHLVRSGKEIRVKLPHKNFLFTTRKNLEIPPL